MENIVLVFIIIVWQWWQPIIKTFIRLASRGAPHVFRYQFARIRWRSIELL